MNAEIYRKYARLQLEVGINLQPHQKVFIQVEAYHQEFADILVEEAYKLGAAYVLLETTSAKHLAARVNHSDSTDLEYIPAWIEQRNQTMVDEKWARLFYFGPTEPDLASSLDPAKFSQLQSATRIPSQILSRAGGAGDIAWSGSALPTPKWAQSVFPEKTEDEALESLWLQLIEILHLDESNPSLYWKSNSQAITERGKKLEQLQLKQVRFTGPNTDLTVECLAQAIWSGGYTSCRGEYPFVANLPTFENYTTPDYRKTSGTVTCTRPAEVLGKPVDGAWFTFENGKVVDYGASKNLATLDQMFATCPQAAYLGELALVDNSSPIFKSGLIYNCVLFDENASCHIAFGNGYPKAAPNTKGKSSKELLAQGVNVCQLHHDFIIGSDDVEVDGITRSGEVIPLIRNGQYTEALR